MAKSKRRPSSTKGNDPRPKNVVSPAGPAKLQVAPGNKRRRRGAKKRSPWLLIGGIVLVIAIVVGIFVLQESQASANIRGNIGVAADPTTLKQVTHVDANVLSDVGAGGLSTPFDKPQGTSKSLTGPTGKPEVFFYGAEWCPLCAAERWSMAVALGRFGTFKSLRETVSASDDSYPNTSTLSFYQSSYTSSYIDFVSIENQDRDRNDLQQPDASQQALLQSHNVGGYPFLDIGERFTISHASYDPGVLRANPTDQSSQPLSQQEIAGKLSSDNPLSRNVLGAANYITAAICVTTKNQPDAVCSDPSIQRLETTIGQTASSPQPGSLSLASNGELSVVDVPRRGNWF